MSKWERGENAPDIAALVPLAHLLDVSVEWLLSGTEAEPGTFSATVFATSLTGYAEFAFRTSPAALAAWANAIHYAVTEAVLHHDGVPIKCVGDGFLGFFSGTSQARRALSAARQSISTCNRPELTIVLHSGPIFLGSVGHPEYARTDIIGATVNTAFLLMPFVAACCPGRMGLTESVVALLPRDVGLQECGEALLEHQGPARVFAPL